MLSHYYWIMFVRVYVCLVNDGNGDDEESEGRKKINQIECMWLCDERDEQKKKLQEPWTNWWKKAGHAKND